MFPTIETVSQKIIGAIMIYIQLHIRSSIGSLIIFVKQKSTSKYRYGAAAMWFVFFRNQLPKSQILFIDGRN
jgi:hypothetical protein